MHILTIIRTTWLCVPLWCNIVIIIASLTYFHSAVVSFIQWNLLCIHITGNGITVNGACTQTKSSLTSRRIHRKKLRGRNNARAPSTAMLFMLFRKEFSSGFSRSFKKMKSGSSESLLFLLSIKRTFYFERFPFSLGSAVSANRACKIWLDHPIRISHEKMRTKHSDAWWKVWFERVPHNSHSIEVY